MIAPALETPRLKLRDHRLDDFADLIAMWADPAVTRFIGGKPFTPEESWYRLLRHAGHWNLLGYGYWVIEEKATGHFIGQAGFADYKRVADPPEIGWALIPSAHGQGFASEAVEAVIAWGDRHLDAPRSTCIIHPDNAPSIRIAKKFGYKEVERTEYKGDPTIVFVRDQLRGVASSALA